jgi:hypothetical protein
MILFGILMVSSNFDLKKWRNTWVNFLRIRTNTLTSLPDEINMRISISGAQRVLIHEVFPCEVEEFGSSQFLLHG